MAFEAQMFSSRTLGFARFSIKGAGFSIKGAGFSIKGARFSISGAGLSIKGIPDLNPLSYLFEVWAFSFSQRHLSSFSCINEYLATDSGGNMFEWMVFAQ